MRLLISSAILFFIFLSSGVQASERINTFGSDSPLFGSPKRTGVAIRGYDTVAYFIENTAVPGKDEFVTEYMGAKWKFSSQQNLDKFKADPVRFAPQYGGYCAYGVTKDYLVKVEPDQFSIVDGKLYLNYDKDVQATWTKDRAKLIKAADMKFEGLAKK